MKSIYFLGESPEDVLKVVESAGGWNDLKEITEYKNNSEFASCKVFMVTIEEVK